MTNAIGSITRHTSRNIRQTFAHVQKLHYAPNYSLAL